MSQDGVPCQCPKGQALPPGSLSTHWDLGVGEAGMCLGLERSDRWIGLCVDQCVCPIVLKQSREDQTFDCASGRIAGRPVLLGTLGSGAHSPAPGRPVRQEQVSFTDCPLTSIPPPTHLVALGIPEYTPQHAVQLHIQHSRKYTVHTPHNTGTQEVTEHITQTTVTQAASHLRHDTQQ